MVEGTDLWLPGDDLACLIGLVKDLMQNLEIEPEREGEAFARRDIEGLLCCL